MNSSPNFLITYTSRGHGCGFLLVDFYRSAAATATATKNEFDYNTVIVIDLKTKNTVQKPINSLQDVNKEQPCFRSDHRYNCHNTECYSWNEC